MHQVNEPPACMQFRSVSCCSASNNDVAWSVFSFVAFAFASFVVRPASHPACMRCRARRFVKKHFYFTGSARNFFSLTTIVRRRQGLTNDVGRGDVIRTNQNCPTDSRGRNGVTSDAIFCTPFFLPRPSSLTNHISHQ